MSIKSPAPSPQPLSPDWLWHYLKRVPAEVALLRAMEARFVAEANLAQPCLDLRDEHGQLTALPTKSAESAASIVLIGTGDVAPNFYLLNELSQRLAIDGTLLITLPAVNSAESAQTWAKLLNQAGLQIERWQPFFDDNAQHVSNLEQRHWSAWLYELAGHHTLPWHSILNPIEANLRPYYENRAEETGNCLLFVATKLGDEPIEQTLPAPAAWVAASVVAESDKTSLADKSTSHESAETAPTLQPAKIVPKRAAAQPTQRLPSAESLLLGLVIIGTLFAQFTMLGSPGRIGGGLVWLLIALGAMRGLNQRAADASPNRLVQLINWLKGLPTVQLVTIGASLSVSLIAYLQADRPLIALPLWLIAIIATAVTLFHPSTDPNTEHPIPNADYRLPLILLFALAIRFYRLTAHPWVINGAEAQLGLDAIAATSVFSTGWLTNPTLPLFLTKATVAIFGRTPFALRFFAPIIGAATVYAIYHIGKRLWNEQVGLTAAILLAGSHFHIHYSRIGLTNVWDGLLTLLAMGGIAVAWHSQQRNAWLGAGAAIGLCAYVFTSAHLVPLMLVALVVLALLLHRDQVLAQWQHIAAATVLALVIALPQIVYYNDNPHIFMERANLLGIQENGWLSAESISTNLPQSTIFRQQLWHSALGFTATLDRDGMYNPGVPLVNWLTGALVLLGVGMAVFHIRQLRYTTLLLTIAITILFGGALLVEAPHSRRYLIALPAVLLLAARALVWLGEKIRIQYSVFSIQSNQPNTEYRIPILLFVAIILVGLDINFYFGRYQNNYIFADRNTELAHEMADYLNELEGDWTAYFHGAPAMYISFSTLPFMATEFEANINLFDAVDPTTLPPANSANVVHIFVPERMGEMELVRGIRPNGTTTQIDGFNASPLFLVYESSP